MSLGNAVDRDRRSLVHCRYCDLRIPLHATILDRVLSFLLATSDEVASIQEMDDDFVLRAIEIVRRLLTDLPAGKASADEKCQCGSDRCGFHKFLLFRLLLTTWSVVPAGAARLAQLPGTDR